MVAMAIAAAPLWLLERSARFRRIGAAHGAQVYDAPGAKLPPRMRWHRDLARKYDHAADRPWLPVTPDPPAPW